MEIERDLIDILSNSCTSVEMSAMCDAHLSESHQKYLLKKGRSLPGHSYGNSTDEGNNNTLPNPRPKSLIKIAPLDETVIQGHRPLKAAQSWDPNLRPMTAKETLFDTKFVATCGKDFKNRPPPLRRAARSYDQFSKSVFPGGNNIPAPSPATRRRLTYFQRLKNNMFSTSHTRSPTSPLLQKSTSVEEGRCSPSYDVERGLSSSLTDMFSNPHSPSAGNKGNIFNRKKIWRTKSKLQPTPATAVWAPAQGNSQWSSVNGRSVQLSATPLQQISDIEFNQLQKISLQKLQAIDIGHVTIPKDPALKRPKKGGSILRSKQKNTNLIDLLKIKESSKDGKDSLSGLMFGISLEKCISHDDQLRKYRSSRMRERRESLDLAHTLSVRPTPRQMKNVKKGVNFNPSADKTSLLDALSLSTAGSVTHRRERRKSLNPREPQVPQVVVGCIRHLEKYGMRTVGIFRVGASKKRTRQLRERFDSGEEVWLHESHSMHDVGALLKEFFRDIPEPLLTRELYTAFVAAGRVADREKQLQILQWLVYLLPTANRDTLYALLKFLRKVADNADDIINEHGEEITGNKMDVQNLGTLFGPNILRKTKAGQELHGEAMEQMEESRDVIATVSLLVDHHEDIFMVPASLLDEVLNNILETEPDALDYLLNRKASCLTSKESTDLESTSTGSLNDENDLSTSLASSTELDPFQSRFPSHGRSSNSLTGKIVEDPEELSYAGPYPIYKSSDASNSCHSCEQGSPSSSERKFVVSPQVNNQSELSRGCSSPELGMRNHNNNVFAESLLSRERQNPVTLSPRTSRRIKYAEIQSGNSGCPNVVQTSPAQRSPSMQKRYVGNISQTPQNDQLLTAATTETESMDRSPVNQIKSPKLVRRSATAAFTEKKQKEENATSPVWLPKGMPVESTPDECSKGELKVRIGNSTPSVSSYASVESELWFTPPISPLDLTQNVEGMIRNNRLSSGSFSDSDEERNKKKKEESQWKQWEKMAAENRGDLLGQETLV